MQMPSLRMCAAVLIGISLVSPAMALRSAGAGGSSRAIGHDKTSKNPLRKVITLLQNMAKKVEEEGEREKELYEKFSCYCKTGTADLQLSISDNDAKVPAVQSDIEEAESQVAKLKEDLKRHHLDRDAAEKAMSEATALREKEEKVNKAQIAELQGYVDALNKAIPAVQTGMAGTRLLQTRTTLAVLRRAAAADQSLTEDDRTSITAFLSGGSDATNSYVPSSGEIVGILNSMKADFEKDLQTATASEEEAQKLYDDLIASKGKEVKSLTMAIDKKTARVGELEVDIVKMKQDMTEAEAMLVEDQKLLQALSTDCESKDTEWEQRKKTRAEELVAIHDTIKILNDDDALDLFKKTLSSASFVQVKTAKQLAKEHALSILSRSPQNDKDRPEVRFLELALMGKAVDFTKVIKMIDDMIALLDREQTDDDMKKEYCGKQISTIKGKVKDLNKNIADLETSIEERTEKISSLVDETKTLQAGIAELDKLVLEQTEQRKEENQEFTELMSSNIAAKELLEYAKNRLQKFYNPKLYKEPKREMTEEEQVYTSMGGELEPAILLQVSHNKMHRDLPAAPETWGTYSKKSEESGGVLSMLDLLIRDLTKELTEAEHDEENAQKAYEELMADSAKKRAKDLKAIAIKESAKAQAEETKTEAEGSKDTETKELKAITTYQSQIHADCDWLLQNYDLRNTARADEVDNLKKAKAILKGADFSLVQATSSKDGLLRRSH